MLKRQYMVQGLKYATITLALMVGALALAGVMKAPSSSVLTGRLVRPQEQGVIPTVHFDAERARTGFSAPTDTHVIFTVPPGGSITRIVFFGGRDIDQKVKYWGYCFSGNEETHKEAGLLGKKMYDGQFFYSLAEREEQEKRPDPPDTDLVAILKSRDQLEKEAKASIAEIFQGGQTCYAMFDSVSAAAAGLGGGIPSGLDDDQDDFNNMREIALGTDPRSIDTDRDGVMDSVEILTMKTDPKLPDTDGDLLGDGCEDQNHNGRYDGRETSPISADSDRDGLCDGNGYGSGCPEAKQLACTLDGSGNRQCQARPSTPVYGEDMNLNCQVDSGETDPRNEKTFGLPDWDYKWNAFQSQYGVRPSGQGTPAPEFPIPALPVDR